MQKHAVSIIIPTLNEEIFLPKLLDSLVVQTDKDFEVIVVDGKSKDKTVSVARTYKSKIPHLIIIESDKQGVSYQKNLGAKMATSDWVLFIDADAILYPHAIERVKVFLDTPGIQFFTSWFSPDTNESADVSVSLLYLGAFEGGQIVKKPIAPVFVGVKKMVFWKIGGYDETRSFGEDYDFAQNIVQLGASLSIIRETLYIQSFRRHRQQGHMKVLQAYAKGFLSILMTSRTPKNLEGYELGGQLYEKKKNRSSLSLVKHFRSRLKKLVSQFVT